MLGPHGITGTNEFFMMLPLPFRSTSSSKKEMLWCLTGAHKLQELVSGCGGVCLCDARCPSVSGPTSDHFFGFK